jgi:O-antigen/teichoic acid export membrane protein
MGARVLVSKRLILINSASSLAAKLLNLSVLVWLQQYLLRRISPAEYSLLPVLYSVMAFAPLVTTILTGGLGRYITVAYARGDDDEVTRIVSTMFPILCAAGLCLLTVGWVFAWHVDSALNIPPERIQDARLMMAILMLSAAVRLPLAPFGAGFFVRQRFVLQNIIKVGCDVFRLALLFTLLFGVSTRVLWVITATTAGEFLNLAISRSVSMRLVPALRFRWSHIHWPVAKEITSFGGWQFVGQVADTIRVSMDPIILNRFATPIDVTCFHIGTLAMRHIHQLSMVMRSPLQPALTAVHATGDADRLARMYVRGGRIALWSSLVFVVPLSILAPDIIRLYVGEKYAQAVPVMVLSLFLFPLAYGSTMTPAVANAKGKIREWTLILAGMNALNVILTVVFVVFMQKGAVGSIAATMLAMAIAYPLFVYPLGCRLAQVTMKRWLRETIAPGLGPAIASGVVLLTLRYLLSPTTWVGIGAVSSLGTVAYLVCGCFLMSGNDRRDLNLILQRISMGLIPRYRQNDKGQERSDAP